MVTDTSDANATSGGGSRSSATVLGGPRQRAGAPGKEDEGVSQRQVL